MHFPDLSNPRGRCPTCRSQKTLLCTLVFTGHAPTSFLVDTMLWKCILPSSKSHKHCFSFERKTFPTKAMGSYWSDLRASIEAPNLTLGGLDASEIRPKNSPPLEAIVLSQNPSINLFLKILQDIKNSRPWITEQNGCFRTLGVAAPQKNTSQTAPRNLPLKPKSPWCRCQTRQGQGCHCWFCGGQAFVWPN